MSAPRRAIGIDIGGTKIAVAAVDPSGSIAAQTSFATEADRGFEQAVERMQQAAAEVLALAGWSANDLCGLGVGCAGPVDPARGTIHNPYTLPTWDDCPIVERLRQAFGRPAYLENDADAAALGECLAGAARGCSRVVMLTLGTGVGGAAIIDGQVYRGTRGEHPELGHIRVADDGPECYCGMRGCLESLASGGALAAAAESLGWSGTREVFARDQSGDARARAIVEQARAALVAAAWTILHTHLPELIVLGGGMADEHFERLAGAAQQVLTRATMASPGACRIVRARLGNDAGLVGAASLALRRAV